MSILQNPSSMLIRKELAGGHKFTLEERISSTEYHTFLIPDLLTNLLSPVVTPHDGTTFQWDVVTKTVQKVSGKSYSQDGPSLTLDTASQREASIPAFGVSYELSGTDVNRRRKAGAYPTIKEAIADLMSDQAMKMMNAYDIFNEDALIDLIVNDRNIVAGGPFQQYNWSTVYTGAVRPAAIDLDVGAASASEVRNAFYAALDKGNEALRRRGLRASGWMHVCGENMFNGLADVEASLGDAYDIRPTLNLAVEGIPSMMVSTHNYRWFRANQTGVLHILYKASMDGVNTAIDTEDGYLIPIGVENMFTIELAPDVDLTNTDTPLAQPMYMYYEQTRHELRVASSTNRLFMCRVPEAIIATTTGA
jgi:hypothetical protein